MTDRSPLPQSKKWGALGVINALFKIYFSINNLRLCQNLIRAVEGPAFPKALDGQVYYTILYCTILYYCNILLYFPKALDG